MQTQVVALVGEPGRCGPRPRGAAAAGARRSPGWCPSRWSRGPRRGRWCAGSSWGSAPRCSAPGRRWPPCARCRRGWCCARTWRRRRARAARGLTLAAGRRGLGRARPLAGGLAEDRRHLRGRLAGRAARAAGRWPRARHRRRATAAADPRPGLAPRAWRPCARPGSQAPRRRRGARHGGDAAGHRRAAAGRARPADRPRAAAARRRRSSSSTSSPISARRSRGWSSRRPARRRR